MSTRARFVPAVTIIVGALIAAACTLSFPAVRGLGSKVRLPVFHGALTWVILAAFSVMGVLGLVYLISGRESAYSWEQALRWVGVPVWLVGSVLGLLAALNTWDFTGSKSSPLEVAAADPRLTAQGWILLAALALIALQLVFDSKRMAAAFDAGFVALMWGVLLRALLGPGRALHPDSPVLNSDEIRIKLLFFGIAGGLAIAFAGACWAIVRKASQEPSAE